MDLNNSKIIFSVDKIDLLEEINDNELMKLRLWIVSEGNNKHNMPIQWDTIKQAKMSLVGKPVLAKYNKYAKDFEGHEVDEIPVGVFLKDTEIYEEVDEDGKRWLVADAYIWKRYCKDVVNVFKRDKEKAISMEIIVLEILQNKEKLDEITSFLFTGVTLIGVNPAIENAKAEVLKFSELVEKTEAILNQNTNFSIDNNKKIVDINLPQKEAVKMVFNKEEFAKSFSLTANEIWEMLSNSLYEIKYNINDDSYCKYWMRDYDDVYVYAYDEEENKLCAIPYSIIEGKPIFDFENRKAAKLAYIISDEESNDLDEFAEKILKKKMSAIEKEKEELFSKYSSLEVDFNCMKEKMSALEAEKKCMSEKFSVFENERAELNNKVNTLEEANKTLKDFEFSIKEQEKKMKVDFAINSVSEDLTQEQIDEWRNKVSEFESVELFSTAIAAFAYSVSKGKKTDNGIVTAAIPLEHKNNNINKKLWD